MKIYARPSFKKSSGLEFVLRPIRKGWTLTCRQCSSCHGCR